MSVAVFCSLSVSLSVSLSSFSFSPETRRQKEVRPEGNSSVTSFLRDCLLTQVFKVRAHIHTLQLPSSLRWSFSSSVKVFYWESLVIEVCVSIPRRSLSRKILSSLIHCHSLSAPVFLFLFPSSFPWNQNHKRGSKQERDQNVHLTPLHEQQLHRWQEKESVVKRLGLLLQSLYYFKRRYQKPFFDVTSFIKVFLSNLMTVCNHLLPKGISKQSLCYLWQQQVNANNKDVFLCYSCNFVFNDNRR